MVLTPSQRRVGRVFPTCPCAPRSVALRTSADTNCLPLKSCNSNLEIKFSKCNILLTWKTNFNNIWIMYSKTFYSSYTVSKFISQEIIFVVIKHCLGDLTRILAGHTGVGNPQPQPHMEKQRNMWLLFSASAWTERQVRAKLRLRGVNQFQCPNSSFLVFFPFGKPSKSCRGFSFALSAKLLVACSLSLNQYICFWYLANQDLIMQLQVPHINEMHLRDIKTFRNHL